MSSPPPSPCAPGRRTDARAGTDPCRPSAQHPSRPDAGRALLGPGRSRGLSRGRADATGVGDRRTQGRHGPPRLAARGRKMARRREPGPACPAVSEEAAGTTLLAAACRTLRGRAGSARSRCCGPAGLTAAPRGLCGTRGHAKLRGMRLGGAGAPLLRARDLLPRTRIQSCGCRRHSGAVSTSRVLHSLVTLRTRVCGRTASEGTELGGHFYSGALSSILQDSGRTRSDQTFSPRPAWGVGDVRPRSRRCRHPCRHRRVFTRTVLVGGGCGQPFSVHSRRGTARSRSRAVVGAGRSGFSHGGCPSGFHGPGWGQSQKTHTMVRTRRV